MKKSKILTAGFLFLFITGIYSSPAATKTWNGSVSTNWADASNWTGGLPSAGDDVAIPAGQPRNPTMPAGTYPTSGAYASFSISNTVTVTCLGDTGVVNEASGGTPAKPHGIGVTVYATNATISGTLSAFAQGFLDGRGPGYASDGSSYGGKSGSGSTYGSMSQPTALGSGGNGMSTRIGGGAIRLSVSNTLALNGTIDVSSADSSGFTPSGGSIWITAQTLTGSGTVSAKGGNATTAGFPAGSGGRVALDYTNSTFAGIVSVAGGKDGNGTPSGEPGTFWDPKLFAGKSGTPQAPQAILITNSYLYYFPDATQTNYWNLTVSNAWFETHKGSLQLSDLVLTNAVFRFDGYVSSQPTVVDMNYFEITNGLRVTGNSTMYLPPRNYAIGSALYVGPSTNAVIYALGNTNAANLSSGGTTNIPHGTGVTIRCASASIDGKLSADSLGFLNLDTTGPGGGNSASYGGQGGAGAGVTYGALARPSALGSGGGAGAYRPGGGAIRLVATGGVTINGTVTASANDSNGYAGSGGSIWITASTLSGSGTILTKGGNSTADYPSGGGGRIALFMTSNTFSGSLSVNGGTVNGAAAPGKTGTLFRCTSPVPDCGSPDGSGAQLTSDFAVGSNGVFVTRQVAQWRNVSFRWTDDSRDPASNAVNNTVLYTLTGLPPRNRYDIYTNDVLYVARTNSGVSGTMSLSAIALQPALTIWLQAPPPGTVFYGH